MGGFLFNTRPFRLVATIISPSSARGIATLCCVYDAELNRLRGDSRRLSLFRVLPPIHVSVWMREVLHLTVVDAFRTFARVVSAVIFSPACHSLLRLHISFSAPLFTFPSHITQDHDHIPASLINLCTSLQFLHSTFLILCLLQCVCQIFKRCGDM